MVRESSARGGFDLIILDICASKDEAEKVIESFREGMDMWEIRKYSDFKVIEKTQGRAERIFEFCY